MLLIWVTKYPKNNGKLLKVFNGEYDMIIIIKEILAIVKRIKDTRINI